MRQKINKGFTLIEMLVALSVFALLSVMSVIGINQMIQAQEVQDRNAKRLKELELAYVYLQRDIEQIIDRPIRDYQGKSAPAFIGEAKSLFSNNIFSTMGVRLVEFTRMGQNNPLETRALSHLQRVAYYLKDNSLVRYSWLVLDQPNNTTEPPGRVLLTNIRDIHFRYIDSQEQIKEAWLSPISNDPSYVPASGVTIEKGLPALVEVSISLEDWGDLVWVFRLPGASNVAKVPKQKG